MIQVERWSHFGTGVTRLGNIFDTSWPRLHISKLRHTCARAQVEPYGFTSHRRNLPILSPDGPTGDTRVVHRYILWVAVFSPFGPSFLTDFYCFFVPFALTPPLFKCDYTKFILRFQILTFFSF